MKNAEFILSVSLSDPLCFTHNVHWCVFVFLSRLPCRESLSLCPYRPSFTFTKACPSCASSWLHLTPLPFPFLISHVKICDYDVAKFVFHPLPKYFWHSLEPILCTEALQTRQFYMQHSNATPRPSTPSSGCLPQFPFKEEAPASFTLFCFGFFLLLTVHSVELYCIIYNIYRTRVIQKPVF